jgi:predicted nuclease of predicted toxin-antitoxin system
MKLLVDAQLPPLLAEWLRRQGFEAAAAREAGLRDATDAEIWEFAARGAYIIVTKDEDFAEMVGRLKGGPAVLWIRCGNLLNRELVRRFEQSWPTAFKLLEDGARLVELR